MDQLWICVEVCRIELLGRIFFLRARSQNCLLNVRVPTETVALAFFPLV